MESQTDPLSSGASEPTSVKVAKTDPPPSTPSRKPIQLGVVQTSVGGRSNMGNLVKKSRWDQAPESCEDKEIKHLKAESMHADSSTNVKSLIKKFEDISESLSTSTDLKQDGTEHSTKHVTPQTPSRVRLVRTNFMKSSRPALASSTTGTNSTASNPKSSDDCETSTQKTSDSSVAPEVIPVVASKALEIISSCYDSPTDESSQENEVSLATSDETPADSAYASLEKINEESNNTNNNLNTSEAGTPENKSSASNTISLIATDRKEEKCIDGVSELVPVVNDDTSPGKEKKQNDLVVNTSDLKQFYLACKDEISEENLVVESSIIVNQEETSDISRAIEDLKINTNISDHTNKLTETIVRKENENVEEVVLGDSSDSIALQKDNHEDNNTEPKKIEHVTQEFNSANEMRKPEQGHEIITENNQITSEVLEDNAEKMDTINSGKEKEIIKGRIEFDNGDNLNIQALTQEAQTTVPDVEQASKTNISVSQHIAGSSINLSENHDEASEENTCVSQHIASSSISHSENHDEPSSEITYSVKDHCTESSADIEKNIMEIEITNSEESYTKSDVDKAVKAQLPDCNEDLGVVSKADNVAVIGKSSFQNDLVEQKIPYNDGVDATMEQMFSENIEDSNFSCSDENNYEPGSSSEKNSFEEPLNSVVTQEAPQFDHQETNDSLLEILEEGDSPSTSDGFVKEIQLDLSIPPEVTNKSEIIDDTKFEKTLLSDNIEVTRESISKDILYSEKEVEIQSSIQVNEFERIVLLDNSETNSVNESIPGITTSDPSEEVISNDSIACKDLVMPSVEKSSEDGMDVPEDNLVGSIACKDIVMPSVEKPSEGEIEVSEENLVESLMTSTECKIIQEPIISQTFVENNVLLDSALELDTVDIISPVVESDILESEVVLTHEPLLPVLLDEEKPEINKSEEIILPCEKLKENIIEALISPRGVVGSSKIGGEKENKSMLLTTEKGSDEFELHTECENEATSKSISELQKSGCEKSSHDNLEDPEKPEVSEAIITEDGKSKCAVKEFNENIVKSTVEESSTTGYNLNNSESPEFLEIEKEQDVNDNSIPDKDSGSEVRLDTIITNPPLNNKDVSESTTEKAKITEREGVYMDNNVTGTEPIDNLIDEMEKKSSIVDGIENTEQILGDEDVNEKLFEPATSKSKIDEEEISVDDNVKGAEYPHEMIEKDDACVENIVSRENVHSIASNLSEIPGEATSSRKEDCSNVVGTTIEESKLEDETVSLNIRNTNTNSILDLADNTGQSTSVISGNFHPENVFDTSPRLSESLGKEAFQDKEVEVKVTISNEESKIEEKASGKNNMTNDKSVHEFIDETNKETSIVNSIVNPESVYSLPEVINEQTLIDKEINKNIIDSVYKESEIPEENVHVDSKMAGTEPVHKFLDKAEGEALIDSNISFENASDIVHSSTDIIVGSGIINKEAIEESVVVKEMCLNDNTLDTYPVHEFVVDKVKHENSIKNTIDFENAIKISNNVSEIINEPTISETEESIVVEKTSLDDVPNKNSVHKLIDKTEAGTKKANVNHEGSATVAEETLLVNKPDKHFVDELKTVLETKESDANIFKKSSEEYIGVQEALLSNVAESDSVDELIDKIEVETEEVDVYNEDSATVVGETLLVNKPDNHFLGELKTVLETKESDVTILKKAPEESTDVEKASLNDVRESDSDEFDKITVKTKEVDVNEDSANEEFVIVEETSLSNVSDSSFVEELTTELVETKESNGNILYTATEECIGIKEALLNDVPDNHSVHELIDKVEEDTKEADINIEDTDTKESILVPEETSLKDASKSLSVHGKAEAETKESDDNILYTTTEKCSVVETLSVEMPDRHSVNDLIEKTEGETKESNVNIIETEEPTILGETSSLSGNHSVHESADNTVKETKVADGNIIDIATAESMVVGETLLADLSDNVSVHKLIDKTDSEVKEADGNIIKIACTKSVEVGETLVGDSLSDNHSVHKMIDKTEAETKEVDLNIASTATEDPHKGYKTDTDKFVDTTVIPQSTTNIENIVSEITGESATINKEIAGNIADEATAEIMVVEETSVDDNILASFSVNEVIDKTVQETFDDSNSENTTEIANISSEIPGKSATSDKKLSEHIVEAAVDKSKIIEDKLHVGIIDAGSVHDIGDTVGQENSAAMDLIVDFKNIVLKRQDIVNDNLESTQSNLKMSNLPVKQTDGINIIKHVDSCVELKNAANTLSNEPCITENKIENSDKIISATVPFEIEKEMSGEVKEDNPKHKGTLNNIEDEPLEDIEKTDSGEMSAQTLIDEEDIVQERKAAEEKHEKNIGEEIVGDQLKETECDDTPIETTENIHADSVTEKVGNEFMVVEDPSKPDQTVVLDSKNTLDKEILAPEKDADLPRSELIIELTEDKHCNNSKVEHSEHFVEPESYIDKPCETSADINLEIPVNIIKDAPELGSKSADEEVSYLEENIATNTKTLNVDSKCDLTLKLDPTKPSDKNIRQESSANFSEKYVGSTSVITQQSVPECIDVREEITEESVQPSEQISEALENEIPNICSNTNQYETTMPPAELNDEEINVKSSTDLSYKSISIEYSNTGSEDVIEEKIKMSPQPSKALIENSEDEIVQIFDKEEEIKKPAQLVSDDSEAETIQAIDSFLESTDTSIKGKIDIQEAEISSNKDLKLSVTLLKEPQNEVVKITTPIDTYDKEIHKKSSDLTTDLSITNIIKDSNESVSTISKKDTVFQTELSKQHSVDVNIESSFKTTKSLETATKLQLQESNKLIKNREALGIVSTTGETSLQQPSDMAMQENVDVIDTSSQNSVLKDTQETLEDKLKSKMQVTVCDQFVLETSNNDELVLETLPEESGKELVQENNIGIELGGRVTIEGISENINKSTVVQEMHIESVSSKILEETSEVRKKPPKPLSNTEILQMENYEKTIIKESIGQDENRPGDRQLEKDINIKVLLDSSVPSDEGTSNRPDKELNIKTVHSSSVSYTDMPVQVKLTGDTKLIKKEIPITDNEKISVSERVKTEEEKTRTVIHSPQISKTKGTPQEKSSDIDRSKDIAEIIDENHGKQKDLLSVKEENSGSLVKSKVADGTKQNVPSKLQEVKALDKITETIEKGKPQKDLDEGTTNVSLTDIAPGIQVPEKEDILLDAQINTSKTEEKRSRKLSDENNSDLSCTKNPRKRLKKTQSDQPESEKSKETLSPKTSKKEPEVEEKSTVRITSSEVSSETGGPTQQPEPVAKASPKTSSVKEVPAPVRVSARQKQRQAAAAAALAAKEKAKAAKEFPESSSKKGTAQEKSSDKRGKKTVSPSKELQVKVAVEKLAEAGKHSPLASHKSPRPSEIKPSVQILPRKITKEISQDKLEPITLKLSKEDNPVIVRSSSLSPKKVPSPLSPQTKTLGYTLKIGKDSTTIIPKDPTLSPKPRESSPSTSVGKADLSGKVGYLIKDTGLTITPIAPVDSQEKLSKITLKLSKAGGHPEIKQEKSETWKAIQKLGEIDIVPVEGKVSGESQKRKERSDQGNAEKKLKLAEVTVEPTTSSGMSKLQGLLTQAPLNQSDDSDELQFVGFGPQPDQLQTQRPYDVGLVKHEHEPQLVQKRRGRPRKIVSTELGHSVSHTLPPGLTAKDILAASLQHQTLQQHLQQLHRPMEIMPPQEEESNPTMFPVPLFDLSEDTFMDPSPPTIFPEQVQPETVLRSARGRPIGRSRRSRGSSLLRGTERGGPRGRPRGSRGLKRLREEFESFSYLDMDDPITLDNIDSEMGPRVSEHSGSQITEKTMALLRKSIEGKKESMEKKSRRSDGSDSGSSDLDAKVKEMKEKIEAAYQAELKSPGKMSEKEAKKRMQDKIELKDLLRKSPPELIPLHQKTDKTASGEKKTGSSPASEVECRKKKVEEKSDPFTGIGKESFKLKQPEDKSGTSSRNLKDTSKRKSSDEKTEHTDTSSGTIKDKSKRKSTEEKIEKLETPFGKIKESKRKSMEDKPKLEGYSESKQTESMQEVTERENETVTQPAKILRRDSAKESENTNIDANETEKMDIDQQVSSEPPEEIKTEPEPPPKPVRPRPKSKAEIKRIKREKDRLRREAKKLAALEALKAPPPNPFEEDTRMSATDPNGDDDPLGSGIKKNRMEVGDPEGKEFTVDQIAEYQWPLQGGELYMIQEQISTYLGVKSFKRKYPDLKRRPVEMEERTFLCDSGLVSESMCDLGLTAVSSSEVLDIMFQDFQDQYEELRKNMREKQARELINKQKERKKFEQSLSKSDLKEQAIQSSQSWNQALNKSRNETRRCHLDLQTWTIQYPRSRGAKMTRPTPKIGSYPVALIPGQYVDYYKRYTPQELRYWPVNTVLYGPLQPNERHSTGGSDGSQSESEDSSSSDDSSDSSSEGEGTCEEEDRECKACGSKKGGEAMMQCSQCGHHSKSSKAPRIALFPIGTPPGTTSTVWA